MNQSQSLFRLVKSLSRNETRYITIAVRSLRYAKAYLKLFKELNSQQVYDEQKLKERVKDEPFIKHFAVIKNQLFQFILKELRSYNESSSLDFKLKELLLDAATLYQKTLYRESWHKLQQARQLALKFEDWKVLLEILYKEFMLIPLVCPASRQEKEFLRISSELQKFLEFLNNYEAMAYCNIILTSLVKKNENKGLLQSEEAARIMTDPVLKSEDKALTLRARIVYFYVWSTYLYHSYQYEKAEYYLLQQVKLFENNRHFIEWLPGIYMLALRDLVVCHYLQGFFPETTKVIQQLKELPEDATIKKVAGRRFRILIFSWTVSYEIGVVVNTRMLANKSQYIRERETAFMHQMMLFEPGARLDTLLALSAFYYYAAEYKKTARLIQKILADPSVDSHRPVALLAITLQVIIHFEDQNPESIQYLLKGIKRFTREDKEISKTEKMLISLINHFSSIIAGKNKIGSLKQYLNSFSAIKEDSLEKQYYRFFDVTHWLQQHLSKVRHKN